jgi:hypothetical protein
MGAADTLVVASLGEGFSLVILEAMATGLPVFTTDVGGSEAVSLNMGAVCDSIRDVVAAATTSTLPDRPSAERAHRAQLTHAEWSVDKAADEFLAIFRSARAMGGDTSHVRRRGAQPVATNGTSPTTSRKSTADPANGSSEEREHSSVAAKPVGSRRRRTSGTQRDREELT